MDADGDGGGPYLSTVWTGSSWGSTGTEPMPACWVLSLTPSTEYPSAFGAIRGPTVRALHGIWTPQTGSLRLVAVAVDDPSYSCSYEAVLRTEEDGSFSLQGKYREGQRTGHFVLHAEAEDPKVHISGLWLGEAAPDASLEPFAIPTNPIRWTLATLADGAAFGSGYFDDSGDVPGRPLLFYTLSGGRTGDEVQLVKCYESAAGAGPVPYRGRVTRDGARGEWSMAGDWRNDAAGSFGQFRCRLEGAARFLAHAACCSACQSVLRPGDVAHEDTESAQPWRCCADCCRAGAGGQRKLVAETVLAAEAAKGSTCAEIAADALRLFAQRPFIGRRAADHSLQWLTYAQVGAVAECTALGLQRAGVRAGDKVAIVGVASPAYVAAMLGALLAGCVLVPLDLCLDEETMARCLTVAAPTAVLADRDLCAHVTAAIGASGLRLALSATLDPGVFPALDAAPTAALAQSNAASPFTTTLEQLAQLGRGGSANHPAIIRPPRGPDDLVALLFTSGSTGKPKAAAYSERLTRPSAGASNVLPLVKLDIQRFHPSFLVSLLAVMQVGGRRAIVDDLGRVLHIAAAVRPTHISAPPAFWLLLQRECAAHLTHLLAAQPARPRADLEAEAARHVRLSLGNRLVLAASGGALLAPSTLDFVRTTLRIPLADLYGSRETGPIARNGQVHPGVEVRFLPLADADADAAAATDSLSAPLNRGEIAVHSQRLIEGYFADERTSSAAFVSIDGKRFYRTGDVGEMRGGRLYVLERCGAMQKLVQSEWLAPAKVEAVLEGCPWVAQALMVVPAARTHAVAVVVPSPLATAELQKIPEGEPRAAAMLRYVQLWATHHRMRAHEVPKAVLLECAPWTVEAGLLTPTFKKRRAALLARYTAACEALAAATAAAPAAPAAFAADFAALLERCGVSVPHARPDATLAELGVDSLACARFAALMFDAGVRVASSQSVHQYALSHWQALWTAARSGSVVPDRVVTDEECIDWTRECHMPSALRRTCARERSDGDALLTGGTGFFGPYLLSALLNRIPGCTVYVVVRAANDEAAAKRCAEGLREAGLWEEKQWTRVVVFAGDLGLPRFGLSDARWNDLCSRVAHVYHSGTRVDVTLPYSALRAANVQSTCTAIDLALTAGARLHYVSSASALPSSSPTEAWAMPAPAELAAKSGYGATKAVSEALLHEAADVCGLSVRTFRYSAICGDEHTHHWNARDFSYLLLSAAASVGVLPSPARSLLHWVPVGWAATATVALSLAEETRGKCFHLIGDGPKIDEAAAALRAAGVSLRACTQTEWLAALTGLPSSHQALPLLAELRGLDFSAPNSHSIPTSNTREALRALGIAWFAITPELLRSCAESIKRRQ